MQEESYSEDLTGAEFASEDVGDETTLRAHYPEVSPLAARKCLDHIDAHMRRFIEMSPFLCLGTADDNGKADVSPRGDMPGFVQIPDSRHLVIPDRPGNNRLDTLANVTVNPEVGLIFFVPGIDETVRVNGRARVVKDSALMETFEVKGKLPRTALVIEVREAFMHCAKAIKRSHLWQEDFKVERKSFPTLGRVLKDQIAGVNSAEEADARIEKSYKENLY